MRHFLSVILLLFLSLANGSTGYGAHGITLNGELRYPADFGRFEYTSPDAAKGGELVLHGTGGFDKMNPFTLKGTAPDLIEMLLFDSLGVASLDETSAEYGLIAQDIEVAEDGLAMVYTINPKARFSDGSQVTAEDVKFSFDTLKGPEVHPFYPYYYRDIKEIVVLDEMRVKLSFSQPNRELPMIATQVPVMSRAGYEDGESRDGFPKAPIGSGPYVVGKVKPNKSITYTRNPDYWAKDHPTRKGMFNYDEITVEYYKDSVVAVEAFKAGEFDILSVYIAKQWARDMDGPAFSSGRLKKELFPHGNNAGMQGFLMNSRREIFSDGKVRRAIGLAFDFEWTNEALFYGQYTRADSFFSNSSLAARQLPEGLELEYLNEYRDTLPAEVFNIPLAPPVASDWRELRENLQQAQELLKEAGYVVKDQKLVDSRGEQFEFEILLVQPTFQRVMAPFVRNLEKLGMKVRYRAIDMTLYSARLKKFDFDMIVMSYGQSMSPGNEQRNFWHSEAADKQGSRNYAGIRSPEIDGLIDKVIYARNQKQLTAACKALDRALWYGYYLVPNWYMSGYRIAYRDKFFMPEVLPRYYSPSDLFMTWWSREKAE